MTQVSAACYDLLTVMPICGMTDLTDGKYLDDRNDRAAYLAAQERQVEYLLDQARAAGGHAVAGYRLWLRAHSGAGSTARGKGDWHYDFAAAGDARSGGLDVRELNYRHIFDGQRTLP